MGRERDNLNKIDSKLREHWADVHRHEDAAFSATDDATREAARQAADEAREAAQRRMDEL